MASDKRTQLARVAAGSGGFPIPELPTPPTELYRPERKKAWQDWMDRLNEWRKNIPVGSVSVVRTQPTSTKVITRVVSSSPTPTEDKDDGSLQSVYKIALIGL